MSEKAKALRLADCLETEWSGVLLPTRQKAAAELRLLHAENEANDVLLRQALEALEIDAWQKKLQAAIDIKKHLGV